MAMRRITPLGIRFARLVNVRPTDVIPYVDRRLAALVTWFSVITGVVAPVRL